MVGRRRTEGPLKSNARTQLQHWSKAARCGGQQEPVGRFWVIEGVDC